MAEKLGSPTFSTPPSQSNSEGVGVSAKEKKKVVILLLKRKGLNRWLTTCFENVSFVSTFKKPKQAYRSNLCR